MRCQLLQTFSVTLNAVPKLPHLSLTFPCPTVPLSLRPSPCSDGGRFCDPSPATGFGICFGEARGDCNSPTFTFNETERGGACKSDCEW